MYSFRKSKKGFTLIELMVVVAIIGILALLGLRLYIGQQRRAKDSIAIANAATVHTLIQANLVDRNYVAGDVGAALAITEALTDPADNATNTANLRNPYDSTTTTLVADTTLDGAATGILSPTGTAVTGTEINGCVYVFSYAADSLYIRAVGEGFAGTGPVWIGNVLTALK